MKRRTFVGTAIAGGVALAGATSGLAQNGAATPTANEERPEMTSTANTTGYAEVNGLRMYYEIHGEGEPLILLHGAYGLIDMFGELLTGLAETRQVIALEAQGHGRTADIDRPIRYETMADDVDALMAELGIDRADIMGYSMGGGTAIQVAVRHPGRVRKLVAISASYKSEGMYPELTAMIETITPDAFAGTPMETEYARLAPRPEDFPVLVEKLVDLDTQVQDWPASDIEGITAPTLLIIGDSDVIRPEHALEMFRLLGGGVPGDLAGLPHSQLAVLPGSTHVGVIMRTSWLLPMIDEFLDAPLPEAP